MLVIKECSFLPGKMVLLNGKAAYNLRSLFGSNGMINVIWALMILVGVIVAVFTGKMGDVNAGILDAAKEAVTLCITMTGIVGMWSGIMRIAEKAGLLAKCAKKLEPVMRFIFPDIPTDSEAYRYICANFIANFAGLGWAATPPALKAMKELNRDNQRPGVATKEMCVFLILNISSLQLIPVNIIGFRAEYGAENPTAIILPGLIATVCSTLVAFICCIFINKFDKTK